MPQNEYMEKHLHEYGRRLDHEVRRRKRMARETKLASKRAQSYIGLRAIRYHKKQHVEKIEMAKKIRKHAERNVKTPAAQKEPEEALPTYLLDRADENNAKVLSSSIKQQRKEKAARFAVPLPKVRGIAEDEMFKVIHTGKSSRKGWKRMITKATFVGEGFTRRPAKFERFIRPMALRYKKANVTHPELAVTTCLPIIGVKKNPQSRDYTQLGVLTKGTIIEINVSDLGLVTAGGKVVWGKMAQVTNNPELDGVVNAVLLV